MDRFLFLLVAMCFLLPMYPAHAANGVFIPPPSTPVKNAGTGLSASDVDNYLGKLETSHVFRAFEGQNDALKAAAPEGPPEQIGVGCDVDLEGGSLFPGSFQDGAKSVFEAAVSSVDAVALRLLVDLSCLESGDAVWVLDPLQKRSFGPYTREDQVEGGKWLPVVGGDTAVLVVQSTSPSAPAVRLTGLSHIYAKAVPLSCNINIACETDTYIQELSSGVGLILVTHTGGRTYSGSGALINVPATTAFEPYFLTANHLVASSSDALNAEVFWDFRSTLCSGSNAPSYVACPHSNGAQLLATNHSLDATLIRLDSVPVEDYGRAYFGWDTRDPVVGEDVIVMHHPSTSHMRISYGRVQSIDQNVTASDGGTSYTYQHETRVGWDDGVTEGGSSGSCLLFADGTYRITGTLTTGSEHTCTNPSPAVNFDYFSSFRDFWNDLSPGILSGNNSDSAYSEPDTPDPEPTGCAGGTIALPPSGGSTPSTGGDLAIVALAACLMLWASARARRAAPRARP